MKLQLECKYCKKHSHETNRTKIENFSFITLSCGHTYSEIGVEESNSDSIILADNRSLYPFQVEGVRFLERNNFKGLISDEMGLGKTIQAVGGIKTHYSDLKPILIICKASLTFQWMKETISGTGKIAQILDGKNNIPIPGIEIFISSFDSLPARKSKNGNGEKKGGLVNLIKSLKIKTIIIDECQMMKNHLSSRTEAIREIVRSTKIREDNKNPLQRTKIESIAKDLMEYHGISGRFELFFSELDSNILGLCECRADKEGIIKGKITIQRFHAENSNENDVIETILHEIAHAITPGAGHIKIWSDTAKAIGSNGTPYGWCSGTTEPKNEEQSVKHIIALSGTPIKNNAIEYFPILNLLNPGMFWNRDRFIRDEVDHYWDGKTYKAGGLAYPKSFLEKTKEFIIRRNRIEVLPDLPRIQRDYKYYPMMDEVVKAYNDKVKKLSEFLDEEDRVGGNRFESQGQLLAQLQILRHITGLSKLEPVIDYVMEFIEDNEAEKLTIFHHHIDVGKILGSKLEELIPNGTIQMTSADDAEERTRKIEKFKSDSNIRILIAPTLACGEGINLQFCSKAIIMEREWNPANEEQAEGRFSRIGSMAESILVCYPTATGTIDEFFAELVERKREAVSKSLDGKAEPWDNSKVMRELAQLIVKKWKNQ